jgi:hypothetical protein
MTLNNDRTTTSTSQGFVTPLAPESTTSVNMEKNRLRDSELTTMNRENESTSVSMEGSRPRDNELTTMNRENESTTLVNVKESRPREIELTTMNRENIVPPQETVPLVSEEPIPEPQATQPPEITQLWKNPEAPPIIVREAAYVYHGKDAEIKSAPVENVLPDRRVPGPVIVQSAEVLQKDAKQELQREEFFPKPAQRIISESRIQGPELSVREDMLQGTKPSESFVPQNTVQGPETLVLSKPAERIISETRLQGPELSVRKDMLQETKPSKSFVPQNVQGPYTLHKERLQKSKPIMERNITEQRAPEANFPHKKVPATGSVTIPSGTVNEKVVIFERRILKQEQRHGLGESSAMLNSGAPKMRSANRPATVAPKQQSIRTHVEYHTENIAPLGKSNAVLTSDAPKLKSANRPATMAPKQQSIRTHVEYHTENIAPLREYASKRHIEMRGVHPAPQGTTMHATMVQWRI